MDASGALFKAACYFDLAASHKAGPHGNLLHHRDLWGAMAHLYRLIVAFALLGLSLSASALIPQASGYMPGTASDGGFIGSTAYPTVDGACSAFQSFYNTQSGPYSAAYVSNAPFGSSGNSWQCYANLTNKSTGAVFTNNANGYAIKGGLTCPANSTQVAGGCQCAASYVENAAHTACEAPPDPCAALKGAIVGMIEWASVTKGNNYSCFGQPGALETCQTVAVCDFTEQAAGQAGYTCKGNSYFTGGRASSCVGTGESGDSPAPRPIQDPLNPDKPPSPGQPVPARCPEGQAPGEFNGTRICAPTGSGTQTSTPAPGNGSTTVNNSDGSSTTSTQTGRTTCQQGQCTTTTNTTNVTTNAPGNNTCPSGQTSGTTTVGGQSRTTCTGTGSGSSTQAQSGFCEKNPKDKQCDGDGADSSFGGSCAGGFKAVSDDPVLNAMAEEQHKRNCEVLRTDGEPSTWLTAEGQKADNVMANSPHNAEFTIGAGSFDTSDALGGGGCSLNKTVTVRGYSVALPFNVLCDPLAVFGQILVAVAFLLAARIVTRG